MKVRDVLNGEFAENIRCLIFGPKDYLPLNATVVMGEFSVLVLLHWTSVRLDCCSRYNGANPPHFWFWPSFLVLLNISTDRNPGWWKVPAEAAAGTPRRIIDGGFSTREIE